MAHTPGPWKGMTFPDADEVGIWNDEETIHIGQADNKANAHLIAAAPDMLAALELYVALDNDHRSGCTIEPDDWAECHQAAAAAIAKAKGEDA